jgi:hypothetical protein
MKRKSLFYVLFLSIAVSAAVLYGCGQSNSNSSTPHGVTAYVGTQSPGDIWSWTLGDGTFIATNETISKYYSGTFSTLPSGFLKGVVTGTDDTRILTDGTAIFYMLEYPDTMLLVKPGGNMDRLIACAARATGSPEAGQYNFVKFPYPNWTTSHKAYGTVEVTVSGGLYNFYIMAYQLDGSLKSTDNETGYLNTDGRLIRAGSSLEVFMTPSGIFFGDSTGSAGFAGVKNEPVTVSDLIAQNYRGILFDYNSSTGLGSTVPVGAGPHPTLANSMQGWGYVDIENNIPATSNYVTLTFGAQDSSGVFSGTRTGGNNTKDFKLVAAKIDGKYIIIGIEAADEHSPENFLLVQQ